MNQPQNKGHKLIVINIREMCWGDAIGKVWVYQYLSEKIRSGFIRSELIKSGLMESGLEDVDIWINDQWGVSQWLQLPEPRVRFNEYLEYYQVLTHHRHWWCYGHFDALLTQDIHYMGVDEQTHQVQGGIWKPMFWDISGLSIRFRLEKWNPPFIPTQKLKQEFHDLVVDQGLSGLDPGFDNPGNWMVFHFHNNFPDHFDRVRVGLSDFAAEWVDQRVISFVKSGGIILSTDAQLTAGMFKAMNLGELGSRIVNLGRISPWLKLYLMQLAGKGRVFGFHSGFTSLTGSCEVVNFNQSSVIMTGPPIVSYSNGLARIDLGHYRDVCSHADSMWVEGRKYLNWLYSDQSAKYFMYHGLYETFQFQSWSSQGVDSFVDRVSFTRENCLVPYDAEFGVRAASSVSDASSVSNAVNDVSSVSNAASNVSDMSDVSSVCDGNSGVELRRIIPNYEYLWGSDFMQNEMRQFPLLIETLMGIPYTYYFKIHEMMNDGGDDSNGVRRYQDEGG